jgi:flagellin-specific chaperone FliS
MKKKNTLKPIRIIKQLNTNLNEEKTENKKLKLKKIYQH